MLRDYTRLSPARHRLWALLRVGDYTAKWIGEPWRVCRFLFGIVARIRHRIPKHPKTTEMLKRLSYVSWSSDLALISPAHAIAADYADLRYVDHPA